MVNSNGNDAPREASLGAQARQADQRFVAARSELTLATLVVARFTRRRHRMRQLLAFAASQ